MFDTLLASNKVICILNKSEIGALSYGTRAALVLLCEIEDCVSPGFLLCGDA